MKLTGNVCAVNLGAFPKVEINNNNRVRKDAFEGNKIGKYGEFSAVPTADQTMVHVHLNSLHVRSF